MLCPLSYGRVTGIVRRTAQESARGADPSVNSERTCPRPSSRSVVVRSTMRSKPRPAAPIGSQRPCGALTVEFTLGSAFADLEQDAL